MHFPQAHKGESTRRSKSARHRATTPSALLTSLGSLTVKFSVIDALQTATITTISGGDVLEDNGAFVNSITVTGSDDYSSWTWFTSGTKWYLIAKVP